MLYILSSNFELLIRDYVVYMTKYQLCGYSKHTKYFSVVELYDSKYVEEIVQLMLLA